MMTDRQDGLHHSAIAAQGHFVVKRLETTYGTDLVRRAHDSLAM
jgi:hypothetical protein